VTIREAYRSSVTVSSAAHLRAADRMVLSDRCAR
jgi:hypothetical protein